MRRRKNEISFLKGSENREEWDKKKHKLIEILANTEISLVKIGTERKRKRIMICKYS
jgi:hypothetical protein